MSSVSSSSTAAISGTLGIGSGLDLDSLVSGLMAVASQPLTDLQNKESTVQTQISAYGMLQGALSSLQTAVQGLTSDQFQAQTATSTSTAVTATTDGTAVAGSYTVAVQKLAQAEKAVSASVATSTTFTAGKITVSLPAATSGGSATSVTAVDISQGSSLQDIRDAINASSAGISASIVNDGNGSRLVLTSSTTGANQSFTITTQDSGSGSGTSLAQFAFDPATAGTYDSSDTTTTGMTVLQAAQDAQATINGVSISSASNTITGAIDGLTFNLNTSASVPSSATITVASDTSKASTALQALVTAYNSFLSTAQSLTSNDPSTTSGETSSANGPLSGSSLVRSLITGIQNQIFGSLGSASGNYTSLASLGVTFEKDGTLSLDTDTLDTALASNSDQIAKLFASSTLATSDDASTITGSFNSLIDNYLGSNGQITTQISSLNDTTTQIQQQESDLQTRLAAIQANYQARFAALDTLLTNLKSTQSYLTTQLEALAQQRAQIANGTLIRYVNAAA